MEPETNAIPIARGLWQSEGEPAWFVLRGPFPPGRYDLRFSGWSIDDSPTGNMALRFANPQGQFEATGEAVFQRMPREGEPPRVHLVMQVPLPTPAVRFEPIPGEGRFRLSGLSFRRQSLVMRGLRVLGTGIGRFFRSPRQFLADVERLLRKQDETGSIDRPMVVTGALPNVLPLNVVASGDLPPRLNVVLPALAMDKMTGGPNTAINLTYRVARAGVPVRYISADVPMDRDQDRLWEHFGSLTGISGRLENVELTSAHDKDNPAVIGADDVFFGTAWWTVQAMRGAIRQTKHRKFIYIIQDFEPGLYPWSTQYALATETYGMDFRAVFCENLLAEHFCRNRIGRFADPAFIDQCAVFEPAVDRTKFHPDLDSAGSRKKRLVFYARPNAPRNLYEMGLAGLREAVRRGAFPPEEWELLCIGEPVPRIDLGCGVVARPHPWLDYDAYAELLRGCDVGLSLMLSPHTSYPPLELAACGALAVTNTFSVKTADRLRAISANIIPVAPEVDEIAEGLVRASTGAKDPQARRRGSAVAMPPAWDEAFRGTVPRVVEMFQDCLRSGPSP